MNFHKSFQTIDTQVVGEAFRLVIQSPISIVEDDIELAANQLNTQFEDTKNILLNEPRGHRGMHGCLILPSKIASFRLLFFQHAASTSFKYEALAATTTALVEQGLIQSENNQYAIETMQGVYEVRVERSSDLDEVVAVRFAVKPAQLDGEHVVVDDRRYFVVEKPASIQALVVDELAAISTWGMQESMQYEQVDGVIMYEKLENGVRSVTFERDGYILRSPSVDSTLALAAVLGDEAVQKNESIFGSWIELGQNQEVGYELALTSYITGMHQFVVDREDPLPEGFVII